MVSLLVAAVLAGTQTKAAAPEIVRIGGQDVQLTVPPDVPTQISPEVINWTGWAGLKQEKVEIFPSLEEVDGHMQALLASFGPAPPNDAPLWRVKVLVSRRRELGTERESLSQGEIDLFLKALAFVKRYIESKSGLRAEFEVDLDAGNETVSPTQELLLPDLLELSILTRVNRGYFEADDRRYRGPYHSTLIFRPTISNSAGSQVVPVGLFDRGLAEITSNSQSSMGSLINSILKNEDRALQSFSSYKSFDEIQKLDPSEKSREFDLKTVRPLDRSAAASPALDIDVATAHRPFSAGISVSVVPDTARTSALQALYDGSSNDAHLDLYSVDAPSPSRQLSFWAKRVSGSPADLLIGNNRYTLGGDGKPGWILPADSTWHHLTAPSTEKSVARIDFRTDQSSNRNTGATYQFAGFELGSTVPPDAIAPQTSPSEGTNSTFTLPDLNSPDGLASTKSILAGQDVPAKLRLLDALRAKKVPSLEPAIAAATDDIDNRVSRAGIEALKAQGTETAWVLIKKAYDHGVSEGEKVAAGLAYASKKDPAFLADLSQLMVARNWETRVAGAIAIGTNGGTFAQTILSNFMNQPEPEVRYEIAKFLDGTNETSAKVLLFASVNDPSDAVRLLACEKLRDNPAFQKDAYRAVQDDSRWVRIEFLKYLAQKPIKADRQALRQAVTSPDWDVRVAALQGFAASDEPVDEKELGDSVLHDTNPQVQIEVKKLYDLKKIKKAS